MNNIHEMDWAADCWHGHTGMDSSSGYCFEANKGDDAATTPPQESIDQTNEAGEE